MHVPLLGILYASTSITGQRNAATMLTAANWVEEGIVYRFLREAIQTSCLKCSIPRGRLQYCAMRGRTTLNVIYFT